MKLELAPVLNLLHSAQASTLATHSLQMPGYPYATVVPNILDEQHRPVLLISALAEHTKNLLADPKVSISVTESGIPNVQDGQRLTLVGDAEQFEPSKELIARYGRRSCISVSRRHRSSPRSGEEIRIPLDTLHLYFRFLRFEINLEYLSQNEAKGRSSKV